MSTGNYGLSESLSDPKNAVVECVLCTFHILDLDSLTDFHPSSIVFVHGLQGDTEKTWMKYDTFWPRDLLPVVVPTARIFLWGYDLMIAHFWTKASLSPINGHSSKLIEDLVVMREQTKTVSFNDRYIAFPRMSFCIADQEPSG